MVEQPVQRRLAAILAADVAEYSRLMSTDEEGTLARLNEHRQGLVDPKIGQHRGRIVKTTGDGVLVEFASVVDAMRCAVELQRGMLERNADVPEERQFRYRIGITVGDIIIQDGDLFGDGVNIAARLEGLAEPGGICLSDAAYRQVMGKVDVAFEDAGEQRLKNIATPVRFYRVQLGALSAPKPSALALPDKPSIAVLPFQNLSGDREQEYFADGIVEEIITALSRFHGLFVIARNSSFSYKGRTVDVKQIGRELGVRYVLEGSVRKAGNRVRITGQLVDASSGAHLWADRFDGTLEDIFDLQDQVTASVVGAIAPKLERAEIDRVRTKPTESLQAYDHYLRGMPRFYRWSRAGSSEALSHFYRAIELDPDYAAAYGMAARTYVQRNSGGWIDDPAYEFAEAKRLARRAVDLGPDDAVALCTAGFALSDMCGDSLGGAAFVDKALGLNPSLAWAWLYSGWIRASMGDPDIAIEHIARARRLSPNDPQSFSMHSAASLAHFVAGRYREALACAESALREKPDYLLTLCLAAASAAHAGRQAVGRKAIAHALQFNPALNASNVSTLQVLFRPSDAAKWLDGLRKAGLPE